MVSTSVHIAHRRRRANSDRSGKIAGISGFSAAAFGSAEEFLMCANVRRFDCVVLDFIYPAYAP